MDLQTALICVGVFVVSAVVVYLISVLGMREKTFEEAIAEQRRKDEEVVTQKKSDKTSKDKKHKKWGRKSKEKSDKDDETELHVGFKPEAEIIPDDKETMIIGAAPATISSTSGKGSKKDEPRSILINKKEKALTVIDGKEDAVTPKTTKLERSHVVSENENPDKSEKKETTDSLQGQVIRAEPEVTSITVVGHVEVDTSKEPKKEGAAKPLHSDKRDKTPPKKSSDQNKEKRREVNDVTAVSKRGSTLEEELDSKKSTSRELKAEEGKVKDVKRDEPAGDLHSGHAQSPSKKSKKNKDDEALNSGRLTTLIKSSSLNDTEITSLIEVLLDKRQSGAIDAEWLKFGQKVDPMSALRKQLQEAEGALSEERQRAQGTSAKLKELRQELNNEKTKCSQLDKTRQQEVQNLHAQLQRASSELVNAHNKNQQIQTKFTEELSGFQQLKEEVTQLRQGESNLLRLQRDIEQMKLSNERLKHDKDQFQATVNQLELQNRQLEDQVQTLERAKSNADSMYVATIEDLRSQLQISENEKIRVGKELECALSNLGSLNNEIKRYQLDQDSLQNTISSLGTANEQLLKANDEFKQHKANLENQLIGLQSQFQEVSAQLTKSDKELLVIKEENELLASQISKVTEREEAEGQEGCWDPVSKEKANGHIQVEEFSSLTKITLSDHESILHEKEKLLDQLSFELKEKEKVTDQLKTHLLDKELLADRLQEDLKEKEKLADQLKADLLDKEMLADRLQEDLKEKEKLTDQFKTDLLDKERLANRLQGDLNEKEKLADQLKVDLLDKLSLTDRLKEDLKEKEKVAEELSSLKEKGLAAALLSTELKEKSIQVEDLTSQLADSKVTIDRLTSECQTQRDKNNDKILEVQKTEQKIMREVLERIFPSIHVEESVSQVNWLSEFEKNAQNFLDALLLPKQDTASLEEINTLSTRLSVLEEDNGKLQAQVHHYKTSLVETEDILKRLQVNVEEEEAKWKQKLETKDLQIEKMLEEKRSYEASMDQVKSTEEELAEMQERLTELQTRLESEESERRSLEERRRQAEDSAVELVRRLAQVEEKLHQCESMTQGTVEAEALKVELANERQSHRELVDQMAEKLRIFQDALQTEQEQNKSLQAKLEIAHTNQVPTANGSPPIDEVLEQVNEVALAKK